MKIGGFQKVSLVDYPGMISAVIFTAGCNFRCPYCHNPELVDQVSDSAITAIPEIWEYLVKNQEVIEGVVITGGEPTIHPDLLELLENIRKINYKIKIDTNGSYPDRIELIIRKDLVDHIALDIKAPYYKYEYLTGIKAKTDRIKESIGLLVDSNIEYELRTTTVRPYLNKDDIFYLLREFSGSGRYRIQPFNRYCRVLDPALQLYKQDLYEEVVNSPEYSEYSYSFLSESTGLE